MNRRATVGFDAAAVPSDRRFDRYRDVYSGGTDAIEIGPNFDARMTGVSLDRSIIYERHLHDVGHDRTAVRCRRDGMEHFTLTTAISGEFHVDSGAGFVQLHPGESVLLDMTSSARNRSRHAHVITMAVARDRVTDATDADLRTLHGRRIDARVGGLLFDHVRSLAQRASSVAEANLLPLAGVTSAILGLSLGGDKPANRSPGGHRFDEIVSFVENSLADPAFGVEAVLARFDVSRATLYRLFQPQGGFAAHVRRLRVRRLRRQLSSGASEPTLEDIAIEAGFKSEGHASDAFLAAYGLRPGQYRRQAREETELDRIRRQIMEWSIDLT